MRRAAAQWHKLISTTQAAALIYVCAVVRDERPHTVDREKRGDGMKPPRELAPWHV